MLLFFAQTRMNAALIMESVNRTVIIQREATTVLVIMDTYSPLTRRIVMVRNYNNLCHLLSVRAHSWHCDLKFGALLHTHLKG